MAERRAASAVAARPEGWEPLIGRLAGEPAVLPAAVYAELCVGILLPTVRDLLPDDARGSTRSPPPCRL